MQAYEKALLALVRRASGSKKNDVAIVLPSGKNTKMLLGHLQVLSSQTWKKFDALVIGEIPSGAPQSINTLYYSELHPLGSSGSFAIGQILAYQLGYEVIINADLDCLPSSANLVHQLVLHAKKESKVVLPLIRHHGLRNDFCINGYGAVPRCVFDKVGFQYPVFFKGAEDLEYQMRLHAHGLVLTRPDLVTTHPYLSMVVFDIARKGEKYLYYYRAIFALHMLALYYSLSTLRLKDALVIFGRIVYDYCYHFAFGFAADRVLFGVMLDGFAMRLGKRYAGLRFSIPECGKAGAVGRVMLLVGSGKKKGSAYFGSWDENIGVAGKAIRRLSHIAALGKMALVKGEYFEPDSDFIEKYSFLVPYLMFLKPVSYKGRLYCWKKGLLHLLAGAIACAATLPFLPLLASFSLAKIFLSGDYPPRRQNLERLIHNFHGHLVPKCSS